MRCLTRCNVTSATTIITIAKRPRRTPSPIGKTWSARPGTANAMESVCGAIAVKATGVEDEVPVRVDEEIGMVYEAK